MIKSDYENPEEHIFYCDKSDWYDEVDGKRDWTKSKGKVEEFWVEVRRERMDKKDFDFSRFVFPVFLKQSFWKEIEVEKISLKGEVSLDKGTQTEFLNFTKAQFTKEVLFIGAHFMGLADFSRVGFTKEADFREAQFAERADFSGAQFTKEVLFIGAHFMSVAFFWKAHFMGSAGFSKVQFMKHAYFDGAQFMEKAHFWEAQFRTKVLFSQAHFAENANFVGAQFTKEADFSKAQFMEKAHFWEAQFMDKANFQVAQFTEKVYFAEAQFKKMADFGVAKFTENANFWGAQFMEKADFIRAQFKDKANFKEVQFMDKAYFDGSQFMDKANFKEAQFTKGAYFEGAQFTKEVDFEGAQFKDKANFKEARFTQEADFLNCTFEGELFFIGIYSSGQALLNFISTKFSKGHLTLFKDWKLGELQEKENDKSLDQEGAKKSKKDNPSPVRNPGYHIQFKEVIFNDHVEFLDCDFSMVAFEKCDLVEAKFSNCEFPKKKFRTHFVNERYLKPEDDEIEKKNSKRKHFEMIGEVYRQLKTNMIDDKYWQEAGDAYRAEMVIRRKVLKYQWLENPQRISILFNWLINIFHDRISAYQQSMSRPFLLLGSAWLGFGVVYYLHLAYPDWPISLADVKESALRSAYYLLAPLGIIRPEEWNGFHKPNLIRGLIYSERILGGILLTFFILATRARMKQ